MVWKSNGDGIRRKYDFSYDASLVNYTVKMGDGVSPTSAYYSNGNIRQMQQWGLKLTGSGPVDNLTYTYNTNSNKLKNVLDGNNDSQTKLGDFRVSALYMTALGTKTNAAIDYVYDDNGNMIKDRNKDIGDGSNNGIVYNHLNLPQTITIRTTAGAVKGTITYTYDAAGNKLRKVTLENGASVNGNATTITTTVNYLGISVDESKIYSNGALLSLQYTNKLQFIAHEEGRIRFTAAAGATPAKFAYDYFVKDHLGNTRMVLTDELQTDMYPAATMELATATTEQAFYNNLPATRVTTLPSGYPANTPAGNAAVAKVNGAGNKIGPSIILKVMSGDKFNLAVNSWWSSGNTTFPVNSVATDLATALANGLAGLSGKVSSGDLVSSGLTSSDASDFLSTQAPLTTKPKAYINWILLDEQFKIVKDGSGNVMGSGSEQVGATGIYTPHSKTNLPVTKNGYLYIYVSNETTNTDVFFDNLQVTHIRGPILEETHYYPFGLTMNGISSKALKSGYAENKYKFNGIEQNTDFDINMYDAFYRNLDPQIGRFWQIDPELEAQESYSPYESMGNNPVSNADPLGDYKHWFGAWLHSVFNGGEVGKNTFGEYYVSKTSSSSAADGSVSVVSTVSYGKGRTRETAMKEETYKAWEEQHGPEIDLALNGEQSIYQRYNSQQEANEAIISMSVRVLLPNPFFRAGTNVINATQLAKKGEEITQKISKSISIQKQARHVIGTAKQGGGYLNSAEDAQKVLDAAHSGEAVYLGTTKAGQPVYRYSGVTGTNVNVGAGITGQATNIFIIKGTISPSVVPTSPAWTP